MQENRRIQGHLFGAFSVLVWGTTFVSTKVLLRAFTLSTEAISSFSYRNSRSWIVCPVAPLRTETSISSTT